LFLQLPALQNHQTSSDATLHEKLARLKAAKLESARIEHAKKETEAAEEAERKRQLHAKVLAAKAAREKRIADKHKLAGMHHKSLLRLCMPVGALI